MRESLDGRALVIPGAWNARIFTPEWVTKYLAEAQTVEVALGIGQPAVHLRIAFGGIYLLFFPDRIILKPENLEDARLAKMETVASKILTTLAHTPISGTGINFQFIESSPSPQDLRIFDLSDNDLFSDRGFSISIPSIRRTLKRDTKTINLSVTKLDAGGIQYDVNFHADTPTTEAAISAISNQIIPSKTLAYSIMKDVYDKQPD